MYWTETTNVGYSPLGLLAGMPKDEAGLCIQGHAFLRITLFLLLDGRLLQCLQDWPATSVVRLANMACNSDGLGQ